MQIQWLDLCEKLAALKDPQAFAKNHGVSMMAAFSQCDVFPANPGQEAMRDALRGLGYVFGDGESVSITTLQPPA